MWHHVAAVFSSTNDRSLYVDGRLAATSTTTVNQPSLIRFGVGGLTRLAQTDAFSGLPDEVGLFDTAQSAAQVALLNAFARYDNVPLSDTDFTDAITVFNSQSGSVTTGAWTWRYAAGLNGTLGATDLNGGNPFVVLDGADNGLAAVPEPNVIALGLLAPFWRCRRAAHPTPPFSVALSFMAGHRRDRNKPLG